jgi:1,4-dihydroxy-2-naphthoate octaprenyltransferase
VGRRRAGHLYTLCLILPLAGAAAWGLVSVAGGVRSSHPGVAFLPLAAGPLAAAPARLVESEADGRALLPVLPATGRLQLVFGGLLALSLWLWLP